MPRSYSAALPIAYVVLRVLVLLNWLMGVAPEVGRTIERTSRARMAEL